MHAGHSTYNPPPLLTASSDLSNNAPPPPHPHAHPHFAFPSVHSVPIVHVQPTNVIYPGPPGNQFVVGSNIASKSHHKVLKAALPSRKFLPTLSGFRKLKSLAVLDMDTLDYISEIRECIRYSSSTLKTLKLSFSESLASSSRKPPPELHSDDESDQEDDFTPLVPQPPGGPPGIAASSSTDGATKVLQAQEEKKKQEAVLARIFGLDPAIPKSPPITAPGLEKKPVEDPKKIFMKNLAPLGKFLLTIIKDEDEQSEVGKEALSVITKASKLFVDAVEGKLSDTKPAVASSQSSATKAAPDPPTAAVDDGSDAVALVTGAVERGLFDDPEPDRKREAYSDGDISNPDDVDIESPELEESTSELEESTPEVQQDDEAIDDTGAKPASPGETVGANNAGSSLSEGENCNADIYSNYLKQKMRLNQQIEAEMDEWDKVKSMGRLDLAMTERISQSMENFVDDMLRLELDFNSKIGDGMPPSVGTNQAARMSEYVRSTRGLTLHTLAVYLIPIRASVLTKAIDIHVLRDITLLDVGPQHAFWVIAAKENKVSPLPLRKIYTDNVSMQFMILVNQLDRVDELILLERKQNALLESSTPKTMINMEHIRRIVLKKHASTLKVLMLKNDDSLDWDLNIKSTILLCQRAKQLEELAVKFGTRTMVCLGHPSSLSWYSKLTSIQHTLLQFMPGLTNLRALHTLQFRHEDSCVWVMREFRKFAVDTVSHNPEMKLEYLALEDTVERLVRRTPKKVDKKGKGKEKAGAGRGKSLAELALLQHGIPQSPIVGSNSLLKLGFAASLAIDAGDSEDEDLEVGGKMGLRVETMEDIHFSDIPGVRIFEKGVLYDRL
jgi:hypothetical protein